MLSSRRLASLVTALVLIVVLVGRLTGATLSPADPYNVFVFGNMTESNVDSEGRVAVGGTATFTNFGVGNTFAGNPSSAVNSLVVGGNLSYNGGEVHYGNVVIFAARALPVGA